MRVYKVLMILCGGISGSFPMGAILVGFAKRLFVFFLVHGKQHKYKILPLDQVQKRELSLMNRSFLCLGHVAISR